MKWTVLLPALILVAPFATPSAAQAENLEHVQRLLSTRECPQCDLSNSGFVFANFSKANLQGADFSNANLSRANLSYADLTGANLTGATLFGANLTGAKLNGTNLFGADLRNAYLTNAQVQNINLSQANLQGVVDLPKEAGHANTFFTWAIAASDNRQYGKAVENYSQALRLDPELAPAYLGRGIALFKMGDRDSALTDAKQASTIFKLKGDEEGLKAATAFSTLLETPEKDPFKPNKVGNAVTSIFSVGLSVLKLFVPF